MSLPQIYTPSSVEILTVSESAKRRHPELSARIDKARDILFYGGLQLDSTAWDIRQVARWRIASQSHGGAYIVVNGICPCNDRMNHVAHCKHSIAVALYQKILTNRANTDIRGREIDLGILPDGTFNAYAKRMGMVQMKRAGSAYTFCDAASAVRYSMWLAKREAAQASVNWTVPVAPLAVAA